MPVYDEVSPDNPEIAQGHVFKNNISGHCSMCRQPTFWVDIHFICFLCSVECSRKMWEEYWAACQGEAEEEM